jgi:hypothetical protein
LTLPVIATFGLLEDDAEPPLTGDGGDPGMVDRGAERQPVERVGLDGPGHGLEIAARRGRVGAGEVRNDDPQLLARGPGPFDHCCAAEGGINPEHGVPRHGRLEEGRLREAVHGASGDLDQ